MRTVKHRLEPLPRLSAMAGVTDAPLVIYPNPMRPLLIPVIVITHNSSAIWGEIDRRRML